MLLRASGFSVLLLTACATDAASPIDEGKGQAPPTNVQPGDPAVVGTAGGPVLDLRAEATAIAHHLAEGSLDLATARASFTGRLTAYDFDGSPSFYLVFTAPNPGIANTLNYAVQQGPALLAAGAGTSAIVGADETRPELAVAESGLTTLFDIEETLLAMGGAEQFSKLIAPLPGVLLILDKTGVYWDVNTRAMLSEQTLANRRAAVDEARAANRAAEQSARDEWENRRRGDAAPSVDLASLTTARGNLDITRAVDSLLSGKVDADLRQPVRSAAEEELEAQQNGRQSLWTTSSENCKSWWFFGWHSTCDNVEVGEMSDPANKQAHMPYQGRGRTVPSCYPFTETDTNAALGCGPAAFNALVWLEWKQGGNFTALATFDRAKASAYNRIDRNYLEFTNLLAVDVPRAMGTCSFGEEGSATLPSGLQSGANTWLEANGSNKRMSMIGGLSGGLLDLDQMARTLHDRVGVRGQATIAGFDTDFASSHWSPVARYRIVRPAGLGALKVYVESLDLKGRWYALGGVKLLSAVAWLQ